MLLQVQVKAGLNKYVYMRGNDAAVTDDVGAGKTLDIYLRTDSGRAPLVNLLRIPPNTEPELNSHVGRASDMCYGVRCAKCNCVRNLLLEGHGTLKRREGASNNSERGSIA